MDCPTCSRLLRPTRLGAGGATDPEAPVFSEGSPALACDACRVMYYKLPDGALHKVDQGEEEDTS